LQAGLRQAGHFKVREVRKYKEMLPLVGIQAE
jgi:hypothetical protein